MSAANNFGSKFLIERIDVSTDLDNVEKLRDDSGDASEERWARRALHLMTEAFDFDKRALLATGVL